jgi:hypothetical protein
VLSRGGANKLGRRHDLEAEQGKQEDSAEGNNLGNVRRALHFSAFRSVAGRLF